jgi:hypothetical protein
VVVPVPCVRTVDVRVVCPRAGRVVPNWSPTASSPTRIRCPAERRGPTVCASRDAIPPRSVQWRARCCDAPSDARQPLMILHARSRVASRRPGIARPRGAPGAPSPPKPPAEVARRAPGEPRGSPREVDGMPHPATPPNRAWRWCRPSRRPARPARARFGPCWL